MKGGIEMKTLGFKLEDNLYKKIKLAAVQNDTTVKGYILDLVVEDLKKEEHPSNLPSTNEC